MRYMWIVKGGGDGPRQPTVLIDANRTRDHDPATAGACPLGGNSGHYLAAAPVRRFGHWSAVRSCQCYRGIRSLDSSAGLDRPTSSPRRRIAISNRDKEFDLLGASHYSRGAPATRYDGCFERGGIRGKDGAHKVATVKRANCGDGQSAQGSACGKIEIGSFDGDERGNR
jgi:hypothetical protein